MRSISPQNGCSAARRALEGCRLAWRGPPKVVGEAWPRCRNHCCPDFAFQELGTEAFSIVEVFGRVAAILGLFAGSLHQNRNWAFAIEQSRDGLGTDGGVCLAIDTGEMQADNFAVFEPDQRRAGVATQARTVVGQDAVFRGSRILPGAKRLTSYKSRK